MDEVDLCERGWRTELRRLKQFKAGEGRFRSWRTWKRQGFEVEVPVCKHDTILGATCFFFRPRVLTQDSRARVLILVTRDRKGQSSQRFCVVCLDFAAIVISIPNADLCVTFSVLISQGYSTSVCRCLKATLPRQFITHTFGGEEAPLSGMVCTMHSISRHLFDSDGACINVSGLFRRIFASPLPVFASVRIESRWKPKNPLHGPKEGVLSSMITTILHKGSHTAPHTPTKLRVSPAPDCF